MSRLLEAISFGRFSSKPQERGDSYKRQQEAYNRVCLRYSHRCTPSERYVFGSFFGVGESGFHARHIGKGGSLKRLIDLMGAGVIRAGEVCLVVEAFDRLSRMQPDLAVGLLSELVRGGCPVVVDSPDLWIDPEDLGGHKFILIAAMVQLAHSESLQKSARSRAQWASAREKGGNGAARKLPGWVRKQGDGFALIAWRAEVVRRIFREYAGGMDTASIREGLIRDEVEPWTKGGWRREVIDYLLSNPLVLGDAGHGVTYPVVVSEELFAQVKERRRWRRKSGRKPSGGEVNVFRGLAFDGHGGGKMVLNSKGGVGRNRLRYLAPKAKLHEGRGGEGWYVVPYEPLLAGFIAFCCGTLRMTAGEDRDWMGEAAAQEALAAEMNRKIEVLDCMEDAHELASLVRRLAYKRDEALAQATRLRGEGMAASGGRMALAEWGDKYHEHQAEGKQGEWLSVLRARVEDAVAGLWILQRQENRLRRTTAVQVHLRGGGRGWFAIETWGGGWKVRDRLPEWVNQHADLSARAAGP